MNKADKAYGHVAQHPTFNFYSLVHLRNYMVYVYSFFYIDCVPPIKLDYKEPQLSCYAAAIPEWFGRSQSSYSKPRKSMTAQPK